MTLSTETRNQVIKRLAAKPGANLTKIARMFGLSRFMVQRIVGGNRKGKTGRGRTGARPEVRKYDYDAIYNWIVAYKADHDGCSPSYREIGDAHGCAPAVAYNIVQRLVKDGRATIKNGRICCGHWTLEEVSNA